MGRITVFTEMGSEDCRRVKQLLSQHNFPFQEISITEYPNRRKDMMSLSDSFTAPRVFLNETRIGGAKETIKVLMAWTRDPKMEPRSFFESFVDRAPDPKDTRLRPPEGPPVEESESPARRNGTVSLPDGTNMSLLEMTELLKHIFPCEDLKYHLTTYKRCFRASAAVDSLVDKFELSREKAEEFGLELQNKYSLMDHVVRDHPFQDTDSLFFRLQCHQTPSVLNSYCIWKDEPTPDPMVMMRKLMQLIDRILVECSTPQGTVNYVKAASHRKFPCFEASVCELQRFHGYRDLPRNVKIAFTINLYNLMIKYAYCKVGIPENESARATFLNNVKFRLGMDVLSFNDLKHGVMRANKKAPGSLTFQFAADDDRLRLSWTEVDCRIHFGLTCGTDASPVFHEYTADAIDEELRIAAQQFCRDERHVSFEGSRIHMSSLFQRYSTDFGGTSNAVAAKIAQYLTREQGIMIESLTWQGPLRTAYVKSDDLTTNSDKHVPFEAGAIMADISRFRK